MTEPTHATVAVQQAQNVIDSWWFEPDADEIEGYDLLRDEALYDLVGIPFIGYRVVFRDGIQRKGSPWRDDYASLELRIAPSNVVMATITRIQARRKSLNVAPLTMGQVTSLPGEQVVINDGSTGIYRQMVQYLVAKEHITLPEGEEAGEKGDSIYDLPRSQWLSGADKASGGIDIALRCARGLRFSEYRNEYTGDDEARTWYIA